MVFVLAAVRLCCFLLLPSALWWMRLRGLCKLPDGRDCQQEKMCLALLGRALLSKALIQLSDEWGCTSSLVVVWPEETQPWGLKGSMVGLLVTSKRVYTKGDFPVPPSCGEPHLMHASTGGPPTLAGSFCPVSCGVTALLLWVMVHTKLLVVPSPLSFPQSSGSPMIKSHWPSRPDCQGLPWSFVGSPGWEAWYGFQNLHNSARTWLVLFSSLWVIHLASMGIDFIVIVPLLLAHCGFSLSLDTWYLFLVGSSIHLPLSVKQVICNFVALAGGEECLSFYLAILNTFNILMEKIRHSYRLKGMCKFRDIEDMGTRGKTHNWQLKVREKIG